MYSRHTNEGFLNILLDSTPPFFHHKIIPAKHIITLNPISNARAVLKSTPYSSYYLTALEFQKSYENYLTASNLLLKNHNPTPHAYNLTLLHSTEDLQVFSHSSFIGYIPYFNDIPVVNEDLMGTYSRIGILKLKTYGDTMLDNYYTEGEDSNEDQLIDLLGSNPETS